MKKSLGIVFVILTAFLGSLSTGFAYHTSYQGCNGSKCYDCVFYKLPKSKQIYEKAVRTSKDFCEKSSKLKKEASNCHIGKHCLSLKLKATKSSISCELSKKKALSAKISYLKIKLACKAFPVSGR